MKSSLLEEVTEQKDSVNVIHDSDSIAYLSVFRFLDTEDVELMYADFWMRIKTIESEIWREYEVDDVIISLTSRKNFRNDLTDDWKGNRKDKDEKELTEKQIESQRKARDLSDYVAKLKRLLFERMSKSKQYRVMVDSVQESDDRMIDYMSNGWIGVSVDGDIHKQFPSGSRCFNNHKKHWCWIEANTDDDIFFHIIAETISGGHNGNTGVKGKGKVYAAKFCKELEVGDKSFTDWIDLFPTPNEALLNYRLVSLDQVKNGKLRLITIEELSEKFEMYCGDKF